MAPRQKHYDSAPGRGWAESLDTLGLQDRVERVPRQEETAWPKVHPPRVNMSLLKTASTSVSAKAHLAGYPKDVNQSTKKRRMKMFEAVDGEGIIRCEGSTP